MKKTIRAIESFFYILIAFLMLLPFIYMLVSSFQETYSPYIISFKVTDYTLLNFKKVVKVSGVPNWFRNSLFISTVGVFWTIISCVLAAYGFVRKRFNNKDKIFILFILSMAIPYPATVVPQWLMMGKIGWIDTFWPLILPIPSFLGVLLIRQAIQNMPEEVFESAIVDGCSDRKVLFQVVIPMIKPILLTVAIIYFSRSWNSFLWPLIISNTDAIKTLPVGLAALQGTHNVNYGIVMAGSVLNFLPPFIVYLFLRKYFVAGTAATGLKG